MRLRSRTYPWAMIAATNAALLVNQGMDLAVLFLYDKSRIIVQSPSRNKSPLTSQKGEHDSQLHSTTGPGIHSSARWFHV